MTTAADRTDLDVREINGAACTDRAGLAILTGRPIRSIDHLAQTDEEFPAAAGHTPDRRTWYPLTAARRYARTLGQRRQDLKPPPADINPGDDPDELLDAEQAAGLIQVGYDTIRKYIRLSAPKWEEGKDGILPRPDEQRPYRRGVRRYWRRSTLANHQAIRPGKGAGAGRPPATRT